VYLKSSDNDSVQSSYNRNSVKLQLKARWYRPL